MASQLEQQEKRKCEASQESRSSVGSTFQFDQLPDNNQTVSKTFVVLNPDGDVYKEANGEEDIHLVSGNMTKSLVKCY